MASLEKWSSSSLPAGHDRLQVICCQTLAIGDATFELKCGHRHWHESCVRRWLSKRHTCPVCRAHIPEYSCGRQEDCSGEEDISSDEDGLTSADFDELQWILGALNSYGAAPASEPWLAALRDVRGNLERRVLELDEEHRVLEEQVYRLESDLENQRVRLCCLRSEESRQSTSLREPLCPLLRLPAQSFPVRRVPSLPTVPLLPTIPSLPTVPDSSSAATPAPSDLGGSGLWDVAAMSSESLVLLSADVFEHPSMPSARAPRDGSARDLQVSVLAPLQTSDELAQVLESSSPDMIDDSLASASPHDSNSTEVVLAEMAMDEPVDFPTNSSSERDARTEMMVARLRGAVLRAKDPPSIVFRKLTAPGHLMTPPILSQLLRNFEADMTEAELARVFAYLDRAGAGQLDELMFLRALQLHSSRDVDRKAWELLRRIAAALCRSGHSASSLFYTLGGGRPLSRSVLESLFGEFAGASQGAVAGAVGLFNANGIGLVEAVEFERVLDQLISTVNLPDRLS